MSEHDVPPVPSAWALPLPETVPVRSGELGNRMLQVLAAGMMAAGLVMLAGSIFGVAGRAPILLIILGIIFLIGGVLFLIIVANARLSARFRAAKYRDRLRATGIGSDEIPAFIPIDRDEIAPDVVDRRWGDQRKESDAGGAE